MPVAAVDGSWIVTLKLHVLTLPAKSVAVYVTMVVPLGKVDPGICELFTCNPGQLSWNTGAIHVTGLHDEILVGQILPDTREGASVSFTVTEKEQVAVLPDASVTS